MAHPKKFTQKRFIMSTKRRKTASLTHSSYASVHLNKFNTSHTNSMDALTCTNKIADQRRCITMAVTMSKGITTITTQPTINSSTMVSSPQCLLYMATLVIPTSTSKVICTITTCQVRNLRWDLHTHSRIQER